MDKTEEQAALDKAAVDAMKNAKSNMATVLSRVETLERALTYAISALRAAKDDISPRVYCYHTGGSQQSVHSRIDASIAEASKVL